MHGIVTHQAAEGHKVITAASGTVPLWAASWCCRAFFPATHTHRTVGSAMMSFLQSEVLPAPANCNIGRPGWAACRWPACRRQACVGGRMSSWDHGVFSPTCTRIVDCSSARTTNVALCLSIRPTGHHRIGRRLLVVVPPAWWPLGHGEVHVLALSRPATLGTRVRIARISVPAA